MQVSRRALMVSVVLASLQLLGQGKELPMEHPTFYRTQRLMGSPSFIEKRARKTRRPFSYCMDFLLHRECSSHFSPGFPIDIT